MTGETKPGLHVPWGLLTLSMVVLAASSLGTLAVVASIQNVDTLSTVALALAVVAFAAQLIISLAQANSGAQQIAQTERVNAETQAALSEIRATNSSILANQKDIFSQLINKIVPEVARELSNEEKLGDGDSKGLDPVQIEATLSAAIDNALADIQSTRVGAKPTVASPASASERRQLEHLQTFPAERSGRESARSLRHLSPKAAQALTQIGNNVLRSILLGRGDIVAVISSNSQDVDKPEEELVKRGLLNVEPDLGREVGDGMFIHRAKLTNRGIELARLTTTIAPAPVWLKEELGELP